MNVLYSSGELLAAIKDVLRPSVGNRRVVLVAYVGDAAPNLLPTPSDIELVCSLTPGSTSPRALSRLSRLGVQVLQSPRLHMKVYWSERNGSVIGSANLSANGLSRGGQLEAGVRLGPGELDIDRLLARACPKPISTEDLDNLARASDLLLARGAVSPGNAVAMDFAEWWSLRWWKPKWKMGWWEANDISLAETAKEHLQREYGTTEPDDYINVGEGQVEPGDWILCFRLPDFSHVKWMFVDFISRIDPNDEGAYHEEYFFQAVQVLDLNSYSAPPFRVGGAFPRAFKEGSRAFGAERIRNSQDLSPDDGWLAAIAERYTR